MNSRNLTTLNLEPFLRNAIGVDRFFENTLNRIEHANTGNYPPYNIIEVDENHYEIEVAVAGFDKEEISVRVEDGYLSVAGDHKEEIVDTGMAADDVNYIHRGISARSFERKFALAEHVEVTGAEVINGILKVELQREIPEALKPKLIEIK